MIPAESRLTWAVNPLPRQLWKVIYDREKNAPIKTQHCSSSPPIFYELSFFTLLFTFTFRLHATKIYTYVYNVRSFVHKLRRFIIISFLNLVHIRKTKTQKEVSKGCKGVMQNKGHLEAR